jgi:CMP-N-acetylneuraminic acid synthetase
MIAAIIPARGGSKRLPRKNILPFAGRPLLVWSIAAAVAAPSLDDVWVTTDDDEIADVAKAYGAKVIRRPPELAADTSSTFDAIVHALGAIRIEGFDVEAVATLQPTNPLRPVSMIEEAVMRFRSVSCDSLISVSQRPLKTGRIEGDYFVPSYPFGQQSRLTAPLTYENGLLYITSATSLDAGSLCGTQICAFPTDRPYDEVDIDDALDFAIGESVAHALGDFGY